MTATPPPEPAAALVVAHPDPGALNARRARIAGELNDIVAHAVTALAVCAGAAERQLEGASGPAQESVRAVRMIASEAMADLRRMQALLYDGPALYAPQPGLRDLEQLATVARGRGVPVEVAITGDASAVPPSVAVSIHRIVEAALNEATPGGPASRIEVEAGTCALVLRMAPPRPDTLDDARDRVRLHGGRLEQNDSDTLTVTLPL